MCRWFLAAWLALCAPALAQVGQVAVVTHHGSPAAHTIAFTALAAGTVGGAAIAGSGTYTGTAPGSISTATWGGGCSGASTPAGFTAGTGTWSATFTVPSSAGMACTIAITDNLGDSATSPGVTISGTSYSGPGDVISTWSAWGGLRAYTNAIKTAGTQHLIALQNGGVFCDFLVSTATGGVGLSVPTCNGSTQGGLTPTAFAGTDATGLGSIAGTTLTFTGGHVGDTVSGGTTAPGTYIVSGTSPAWTVNISQTVVSAALTLTNSLFVSTIYDQTGNGFNAVAGSSLGPVYVSTGGTSAGLPWMAETGANDNAVVLGGTVAQPFTLSAVVLRTVAAGSPPGQAVIGNNGPNYTGMYFDTGANTLVGYAGTFTTDITAADGAWHTSDLVFSGSASSWTVDSVPHTGLAIGANPLAANTGVGQTYGNSNSGIVGGLTEFGILPSALSSGNLTALDAQQRAYWGF